MGALGQIGDTRATDLLIQALNDADNYIRSSAAWALGEIGDVRAVERLQQAKRYDTEWWMQKNAPEALEKIRAKSSNKKQS